MVRLLDQVMVPRVPTRKARTEIERMDHRTAQPNQARVCAESTVYTVCVEPQGIAPVRLRLPSPDSWRRHRGQEGGHAAGRRQIDTPWKTFSTPAGSGMSCWMSSATTRAPSRHHESRG